MAEIVRQVRELEDLVAMQDRAIRALETGIEAMRTALYTIQKMVDERGVQMRAFTPQYPKYPLYVRPDGLSTGVFPNEDIAPYTDHEGFMEQK